MLLGHAGTETRLGSFSSGVSGRTDHLKILKMKKK